MAEHQVSSPSRLSVKYLNVQPKQTRANQPVTIYANIANSGDESDNYVATLKINGHIEETRTGRVGSHAAVPLKFEILKDTPGTYNVDINGQQDYFIITVDNENKTIPIKYWVFFGFIIAAILVAVVLVRQLR